MLPQNIDTIIFDLDGTLRHNIPNADETMFNFAIELGLPTTSECRRKGAQWAHYYWAQSPELVEDVKKFDRHLDRDFWRNYAARYLEALGIKEKDATELGPKLAHRMETEFTPQSIVRPADLETLKQLRTEGYTIGLVSNRSNPCQQECEELGLLPYLDFAYVAAEVNTWKPDPAIFERAFEITQSQPENIIYIGDNYYADIIAARRAGLYPILIDPHSIFPEADCTTINAVSDLPTILPPQKHHSVG